MYKWLLLALLVGCGDPVNPPVVGDQPRLINGRYIAYVEVTGTVGTCKWLTDIKNPRFYVDVVNGRFQSPLSDVSCTTEYPGYNKIVIECKGLLTAYASGRMPSTKTYAYGTGTVNGNVGGCTAAAYNWEVIFVKPLE